MTLRLRLTLLYGALFLVAGAILLAITYGLVRRNLPPDRLVFASRAPAPPPEPPAVLPGEFGVRIVEPGEIPREVLDPEGNPVTAEFIAGLPTRVRDDALHELLVQSGFTLGLMALGSVGLGWVVAGRALRPVHHITETARQLSSTNLHERIGLAGPQDELKELADTFDSMLARLDTAFEAQRRFAANASHELRTPLSIIRTELDVTLADPNASSDQLRQMAETVRVAADRAERLIDSLLVLARSERGLEVSEPVSLDAVVRDALVQIDAPQLRVEWELEPASVSGDRTLLEQAVANLLDNALRHNREGGWMRVGVTVDDERAVLRVANSGDVIDADDVQHLFEPFRRAGRDRTGSARGVGLGLSIVRAVATAHGGYVDAEALPDGGLEVTLRLPLRLATTHHDTAMATAANARNSGVNSSG